MLILIDTILIVPIVLVVIGHLAEIMRKCYKALYYYQVHFGHLLVPLFDISFTMQLESARKVNTKQG